MYLVKDATIMCNTYTWATLRVHQVMADFMQYKFDDHAAIASIITRFMV